MKLTRNELGQIKERIDAELKVRCINVETTLENEEISNIKLTSTEFQTIPMLHTNMSIESTGQSKEIEIEGKNVNQIWFGVYASYDGNGVKLFDITFNVYSNENQFNRNVRIVKSENQVISY